jgi:hypothetical protein
VWKSLAEEMRLARQVADVSYVTTSLHMQLEQESNRMSFRTKIEPGHLTDMIATAAAIAELDVILGVIKGSAQIFGWTIDEVQIDTLLAEARTLNEAAANDPD